MKMAISAVIPTFNALELLQKNIPVVIAALRAHDELVIVDDAGNDSSAEWLINSYRLKKRFNFELQIPKRYHTKFSLSDFDLFQGELLHDGGAISISLVILKSNRRFGAAVNIAAILAKNPLLFLCNNDVYPKRNCFTFIRPYFEQDSNVFAVGCLEYENANQELKSGKNKLWFARGLFQHSKASSFDSGPTAWASGGSAVFNKKLWLELGGFDPGFYPAYWEDVDISFRARMRGWKVLFENKAIVYHKHESTNENVFGQTRMQSISWRNCLYFTWKNGTLKQKLLFILWYPYWLIVRSV